MRFASLGSGSEGNRAGFIIHGAIHGARPDVGCVIHTHTRAGMAVAAMKEGLQPVSMGSTAFHNRLSYHDYEGPSLDLDERGRLLANLGDNQAMMLRNHGMRNRDEIEILGYNSRLDTLQAAYLLHRLGKVDDGSAHLDFEPEEQKRHMSLSLSVGTFENDGYRRHRHRRRW